MNLRSLGFGLVVVLVMTSESQAATCESLLALSLPNTTMTMAQPVAAGALLPQVTGRGPTPETAFTQLPAFCRVAATLRPSSDSEIKIEVWMPLANWNNKFQAVGNGGLAGFVTYTSGSGGIERGMTEALMRGYATASTDTGHTGNTAAPFLGHPEKLVDFGYRAVHETTVAAKAIITHQLLQERARQDGLGPNGGVAAPVPGPGNGTLRRRRGAEHVRPGGCARTMGRKRQGP